MTAALLLGAFQVSPTYPPELRCPQRGLAAQPPDKLPLSRSSFPQSPAPSLAQAPQVRPLLEGASAKQAGCGCQAPASMGQPATPRPLPVPGANPYRDLRKFNTSCCAPAFSELKLAITALASDGATELLVGPNPRPPLACT